MREIRPKAIDLTRLSLSAEEGFVLSRVDRAITLKELIALSGLYEGRVVEIVERLVEQGAVEVDDSVLPKGAAFAVIDEIGDGSVSANIAGLTDAGMVRPNNEDALVAVDLATGELVDTAGSESAIECSSSGLLLAVSDGMGGANAGEVASALVLDVLREELTRAPLDGDPARALAAAVDEANARVALAASDDEQKDGMGATLVAVLIVGETAYTAEVGDSRVYLLRDAKLTLLSKDQTHVQVLIDQGLLTEEAAKASRARSIVLQACGKSPEVVVAQRRLALREADTLLLCSDGLTVHLADDDIARLLNEASSLEAACAALVALAKERGGKDNITVLATSLSGSLPPPESDGLGETLSTLRDFVPLA